MIEQRPARDGGRVGDQAGFHQPAPEQWRSARGRHVRRHEAPAGLQVGDDRSLARDLIEHVDVELAFGNARFARDRQQVQDEVGRASRRRSRHRCVAQALRIDQRARIPARTQGVENQPARLERGLLLVGMHGGNVVEPDWREAEEAHRQRHGVGGELPAARTGTRTGDLLDAFQLAIVDRTRAMRADRFEHVLDGDGLVAEHARHDRAAVENDARQIETRRRHCRRRNGLVASGNEHDRVERMAAHGELGGIGDHLAAHQRGAHAARAHGDAVGNDDGVELDRRSARCLDALRGMLGEVAQMHVAGRYGREAVHHGDQRLRQGLRVETGGVKHGARGRP